jgi:hypothetical protein
MAAGKLTGWSVPAGKAIYEIEGGYTLSPVQAPGRPWLAVPAKGRIDLLDEATGACLGQVAMTGSVAALGISPDARQLVAMRVEGQPIFLPNGRPGGDERLNALSAWDLGTGRLELESKLVSVPGTALCFCAPRRVLVSHEMFDLDLRVDLCRYTMYGDIKTVSPDGRLWTQAVGPRQRPNAPPAIDNPVSGRLTTYEIPDPASPEEALLRQPMLDVVFRPGIPVAVKVNFKDAPRNARRAATLRTVLGEFGYPAGTEGWTLEVTGKEFDTEEKLGAAVSGQGGVIVPAVRVTFRFLASDGTEVQASSKEYRFQRTKSRYFKGRNDSGPLIITQYNFGTRDIRGAIADEIWDLAAEDPIRPAPVPHGVARNNDKYVLLPLRVTRSQPK